MLISALGFFLWFCDEAGAWTNMPPEPQAGSKMRPWIRLDDLHDQLDDAGGREELAALLAFAHGELAEEVFVNLAEGIAFDVHRDAGMIFSSATRVALSMRW